jgi:hypothetical protein
MTKDLRNHVLVLVVLLVLWQAVYLFVGDLALRSPLDTARAAFGLVR